MDTAVEGEVDFFDAPRALDIQPEHQGAMLDVSPSSRVTADPEKSFRPATTALCGDDAASPAPLP